MVHVHNLGGNIPYEVERMDHRCLLDTPNEELPSSRFRKAKVYVDCNSFGPRAIEAAVSLYGAERIVCGTDGTEFGCDWTRKALAEAQIGEEAREQILHRNAAAMLARVQGPRSAKGRRLILLRPAAVLVRDARPDGHPQSGVKSFEGTSPVSGTESMIASRAATRDVAADDRALDFDAVIIGAGVSGLYQLYKLRELGLKVRVFETGSGVGGTWYWNRYPGARFDLESYTYGYSFSQELLEEWNWAERFAAAARDRALPQLRRRQVRPASRHPVQEPRQRRALHEETRSWDVTLEDGRRYCTRFLITAIGVLSAPTMPRIAGVDTFQGQSCHTHYWPKEPVNFDGKRVAVIGTGATGVQTIQEVAKTVGHLTVFQRTPNWCAPLHNGKIGEEEMRRDPGQLSRDLRALPRHPRLLHPRPRPARHAEVTPEEREAFWEKLYAEPGFGIWQGNFRDILVDREANALISDFIARKIRQRVKDPAVAEKLIPKNHGFGTRRVPLETNYYEVYNQPNVKLVDINETPIERITPRASRPATPSTSSTSSSTRPASTRSPAVSTGSTSGASMAAAEGQVEGRAADLSRHPGRGLPQHADGDGPACRARQLSARRRIQRRMGDRPAPLRARPRPDAHRGHRRRRRRLDRPRHGAGRGAADERDRLVDDRRQPQRRGQADPQDHALQRRPPRLSRALRCGGGGRITQAGAGLGGAVGGLLREPGIGIW